MDYKEFLRSKIEVAKETGFEIDVSELNPALMPHQKDMVAWALRGGRRALFAAYGLGKTVCELEFLHQAIKREGGKGIIVCPLGVKQEFGRDAQRILGYPAPEYVRNMDEVRSAKSDILITNYERIREGNIDPQYFTAASLDEASILRSFGSKTNIEFRQKFRGVKYKLVATATPSPNDYTENLEYADYLEVMDLRQSKTRFFRVDHSKVGKMELYPNMRDEFWLWISSWALFIEKPSDLDESYSDEGYDLPPLEVRWHELPIEYGKAQDRDGQFMLFADAAAGLPDAAKVKRESIDVRVAKAKEIIDKSPEDHFILWHSLEDERRAIKKAIPEALEIYGSQDMDLREKRTIDFSDGKYRILATKETISGSGCNFQRHCHREIFMGIDYKANDFMQSIHRVYRFLQNEKVIIDIIYMENERGIKDALVKKWENHNKMVAKMTAIVREYGLNNAKRFDRLQRKMGVEYVKIEGKHYTAVNDDTVAQTKRMPDNSVDLIHTSIPFGTLYEYSQNFCDFGHNKDTDSFFTQMDYLTPELLRILKPGRVAAIHVKDRILSSYQTKAGMQMFQPFHAEALLHYIKHGFVCIGMITVVTDVVMENNQSYRLGWSEQCKDGSKMGVGAPEYILLLRKLPTDRSNSYSDVPVTKTKEEYTRGHWQIDAHAFARSSGDRLLTLDDVRHASEKSLKTIYQTYARQHVYNYDEHVKLCEELDKQGKLSSRYMMMGVSAWDDEFVWDDISRTRTLNLTQKNNRKQAHLCLAKGTLILTRRGYIPIEQVDVGDYVLTHKGNWKPVIAKKCTGIRNVIQTKAQGVPNLITTPDHKLWCRTTGTYPSRPKDGMRKTKPDWIEAKDVVGGYLNLKLPEVEESTLTAQEWWIVGRYLADGHIGTYKDYFISVGFHKIEEFEEKASGYYGMHSDGSTRQYRLLNNSMSVEMRRVLSACGRGAENKQVSIEGICLNAELSEALLSGYLSGDGHVEGNAIQITSVSRALLLGMAMVAQRARNVIPYIYKGRGERESIIEGRKVHCKQEWNLGWRVGTHFNSEILDDGAWKKVRGSEPIGEREVWSIQVLDDASYTAEGCIVKNCPLQIDIVERIIARYSNEGEVVYDPFAGIFTVPSVAVKMKRYGYGTELNEQYFRDGVDYCQQAETDIDAPTLFDFLNMEEGD